VEPSEHRAIAAELYNECWTLLENDARTADDDAALLTAAFASRHHWLCAGGPQEWSISDWMVSRASAATGLGELAVRFAERAVRSAEGQSDWLVASAAEGLARAYAARGDAGLRDEWVERAGALVDAITEDEDREIIAGQLASVPR
jgi:hypothetical protein